MKYRIVVLLLIVSVPLFPQTKPGSDSLTKGYRPASLPLVDASLDPAPGKVDPVWAFVALQRLFVNISPDSKLIEIIPSPTNSKMEYIDWILRNADYSYVKAYVQEIAIASESLKQSATKNQIDLFADEMKDLREAIDPPVAIDSNELYAIQDAAKSNGIEALDMDIEGQARLLDNINSFDYWQRITQADAAPPELTELLTVLQVKPWLSYLCENELPVKLVKSYEKKLSDFFAKWGL